MAKSAAIRERLQPIAAARALEALAQGEMAEVHGLMPWSSNYTFLTTLRHEDISLLAIYKPIRGERPLWDFPQGTLALREVAAYVVSEALGWDLIPPTVLRDGAYGPGAVQLFIDADFEAHYFNLRERHVRVFQRVAAFDVIVNNADRKAGHCLLDQTGHIWVVDHGLTFHTEHKLRTVIWDFAGQSIAADILSDLRRLQTGQLRGESTWQEQLAQLISQAELAAFHRRLDRLITTGHYPLPGRGRSVPYPLV